MKTRNPEVANTVETLVRVSTDVDAAHDFTSKFCVEGANWDLAGNNALVTRQFHAEQPEGN